jgi:LPPG:FO 2-phospho-L-lactate transferase
MPGPRLVVLAGGVGGAKFVRGLRAHARVAWPDGSGGTTAAITVVVNTGDDLWLAGMRVTPDLDSLMYALAGVNDADRGWGRAGETDRVSAELTAYGVGWPWFTLGDLDLGTHIARTALLREGLPLSAVTERLTARWPLGVRLLPMSDDEVETHVVVEEQPGTESTLHFEEWWVRTRAALPAVRFEQHGVESARPAAGVLEAIAGADVLLVAPSNPVVSIGTILGVPGIREALAAVSAPTVGVSPIIGGEAVRGMADACLRAIGVATSAEAVARHYGARRDGGLLDAWLVDPVDAAAADALGAAGIRTSAEPLWMTDEQESARIAAAALALAASTLHAVQEN